jgi:hypothetical protein
MPDAQDREVRRGEQPLSKARKPWHVPKLLESSFASTDAMSNAGNDGGPPGTSLS